MMYMIVLTLEAHFALCCVTAHKKNLIKCNCSNKLDQV